MPKLDLEIKFPLDIWPYSHTSMCADTELNYYGLDQEDMFKRNLKYMPDDWIYRNKKISYKFNKQGLRMNKNLEDVSNDYILFSGTSFGMGLGLASEDRYSELISHSLNLDFINFCGPTFSNKLQVLSFFNLLKNNFHKPKILVIEYAPSHGYTFYENNNFVCFYSNHISENSNYQKHFEAYKTLLDTGFFIEESKIYRGMLKELCNQLKIKFVEISFNKKDKFVLDENISIIDRDVYDNKNLRFARDIRMHEGAYTAHPGIGIHKDASKKILNLIEEN